MAANLEEKAKVSFRIPQDVRDWLAEQARENERTMNGQVVAILRERMGMKSSQKPNAAEGNGA
jgi:hypothetical protein